MSSKKVYFPNLNGIRFIAAFLVVIHHIEQIKSIHGYPSFFAIPAIEIMGKLGVVLFFVLSGFLITYLLLKEEEQFEKIAIGKFYLRRVLRIWPLYFFIVGLAFFVLPQIEIFQQPGFGQDRIYENLFAKLVLFLLFFPNVAVRIFGNIPFVSHAWSIGTEEQFYLIWPLILKFVRKNRILLMLSMVLLYVLILWFLKSDYSHNIPRRDALVAFWKTFNVDCMAIGGIFAVLLYRKSRLIGWMKNNYFFYLVTVLTMVFILMGITFSWLNHEIYAIFFAIIVTNLATKEATFLETKCFNFLGNNSYGIYMYHPIAIVLSLFLCHRFLEVSNVYLIPLSFGFTILFSGLSYRYLETVFLRYKGKFALVKSGK